MLEFEQNHFPLSQIEVSFCVSTYQSMSGSESLAVLRDNLWNIGGANIGENP